MAIANATANGETRRILLVEDEKAIREAVGAYLIKEGFAVISTADGQQALDEFERGSFDLMILDLMLPRVSGEKVCQTVRSVSNMPIIMLTAKGEIEDRIAGLELGADDYLVKPFSPRELVARVRALLRRVQSTEEPLHETLELDGLVIDVPSRIVSVAGQGSDLTTSEFKLLVTLARHPGVVYSRGQLVEKVLGYDFKGYERAIDSHIKNLRSKLGDDPREPRWLFTVHGAGYRFGSATLTEKK
jgi:DNA-binding response OmpR family regulator